MKRAQPTLLVVDVDKAVHALVRDTAPHGARVVAAAAADEARALVDAGVDVLLCALRLADSSGLDVIRHAIAQKNSPRAIVALSDGHDDDAFAAFAAARAGAAALLQKPFSQKDLLHVLDVASRQVVPVEVFVAGRLGDRSLRAVIDDVRREMFERAFTAAAGNLAEAARILGVSRQRVSQLRDRGR